MKKGEASSAILIIIVIIFLIFLIPYVYKVFKRDVLPDIKSLFREDTRSIEELSNSKDPWDHAEAYDRILKEKGIENEDGSSPRNMWITIGLLISGTLVVFGRHPIPIVIGLIIAIIVFLV